MQAPVHSLLALADRASNPSDDSAEKSANDNTADEMNDGHDSSRSATMEFKTFGVSDVIDYCATSTENRSNEKPEHGRTTASAFRAFLWHLAIRHLGRLRYSTGPHARDTIAPRRLREHFEPQPLIEPFPVGY